MPQYRMIAIDLDGTLLSPDGRVTPRTKTAVHGALAAGMLVCFATGRNMTESQMVLDAVAHYDTAVFVGGAIGSACATWAWSTLGWAGVSMLGAGLAGGAVVLQLAGRRKGR